VTGSELAAIKASAGAVTSTVMQIVSAYKQNRYVSKEKLRQLELEAETALRAARAHAMGRLYRVNIEEIAETQRYIDSLRLGGPALDYAMSHLEQLSSDLTANLRDFRNG
jgi:hypothetical protein